MSDGDRGNRGPQGGPTKNPIIDQGTLIRQPSKTPGPQCDPDWRFEVTAKAMLLGAHALIDEYAKEIFDLWFSGRAPAEVTFDNEKWGSYMRAEKKLQQQITVQLTGYAELIRDKVNSSLGRFQSAFSHSFHAEVGSEQGEYRTGYDVLHGTNRSAGDFVITGRLTAIRSGPPGSAYTVTYDDLLFVFNDIVDINKKWKSDVIFGRLTSNMARCLGTGPPKDYVLRIKWRAENPMKIEVGAEGQVPGWLKQFPNK